MITIFWIAVGACVFWYVFLRRSAASKPQPKPEGLIFRPEQIPKKVPSVLPTPSSRKDIWKVGPEDVFKKEYVSFSRLKTFKTCPRMFELIYLYGLEDKSGRAAQVGNLVHKIVHLYTMHNQKGRLSDRLKNSGVVDEMLGYYEQAIAAMSLTYDIPKAELLPYLSNFVALNRGTNFRVLFAEYECNSMIRGYKLKCIIDRVDAEPKIVDYKTGKPQNAVSHQLNVYAYALTNGEWTPYQVAFQFLKTAEIRRWEYSAHLHRSTEEWLLGCIQEIENTKIFHRNTSRLCDYCGVSEYCRLVP